MEFTILFFAVSCLVVGLVDAILYWMNARQLDLLERSLAELRLASIEHEERLDLHSESIDDAHNRIDSIRGAK